MRKNIIVSFIVLLYFVTVCHLVPTDEEENIYQIEKNKTIKHPNSTSKREHGKLDVFILRSFLGLARKLLGIILAPLKVGFHGAADVVDIIIPESKGLDTNQSFFNGVLDDFKAKVQLISPGTKWCGPGNVATNVSDVGAMAKTDKCCRNHDLCPENIAAGEKKYGLKNTGLFTRSLCTCDEAFYNCLKTVDTPLARELGTTYFNNLGPQCFELVNCSDSSVKCRNRQKQGMQYQWSDNPKF